MSEASATNWDIAVERVVGFAQKFDRAHLDLACHAAFPQTLTPDLLYQIWLRFVPQAPWTAVARILLSRLCREIGYELYEMDVAVRNVLLTELKEDGRFGKPQLEKLADFYSHYLKQQFESEEEQQEDLTQPQYWIALASTKSNQLSRQLAKAIESRLKQKNWKELFRLASFIEAVPEALVEFEAPLITYARGMLSYTTGDLNGAAEEFRKLQRWELQVEIAGVNLSIPNEVPLVEVELDFLERLLQIISDSEGDARVVYPILQENLDKLDDSFAALLHNSLEKLEKARPIVVANIVTLSNLMTQFPQGNRANNLEIAITGYEIAFRIFTRDNFPEQWASLQNYLAVAYIERIRGEISENLERAINCLSSALEIYSHEAFPLKWAMTINHLGIAYSKRIQGNRRENLEEAVRFFMSALEVYTDKTFSTERLEILRHLGYVVSLLGNYRQAIQYFQESLIIVREVDDRLSEGDVLYGLGNVYQSLENYQEAIQYFQESLSVVRKIGDRLLEGNVLCGLGNVYHSLANYQQAIEYFHQSLIIVREIGDRLLEGNVLYGLGNVYHSLVNYQQAIGSFQECLKIAFEIGDKLLQGNVLCGLGNVYRSLADYQQAIEYFHQSLIIVRKIGDRLLEGNVLCGLGNVYRSLADYQQAIKCFQQSLEIAERTENIFKQAIYLSNLGLTFIHLSQFKKAEQAFRSAIKIWESVEQNINDMNITKLLYVDLENIYRQLQKTLVFQNKYHEALEIAERQRYIQLITQFNIRSNLKSNINNIKSWQIQKIAKNNQSILIEYSIIYESDSGKESDLFIWVIKPDSEIIFRQVDLRYLQQQRNSLSNLIIETRNFLSSRLTFARPVFSQNLIISSPLQQLYQLLVQPIIDDLLLNTPNAHIIFIPQGNLFLVPFAALQDLTGAFLSERYTLSISLSIQALKLTQQHKQSVRESIQETLVVGDPTMPYIFTLPIETQLSSLPGARTESIAISQLLNTQAIIGSPATKTNIMQQMPRANVIHLATHGLLDGIKQSGVPAAIALSPSSNDNGFLTAEEILEMKLKAELVVLSACNTGLASNDAHQITKLPQSLISAGVSSVIVSLWSVEDFSATLLMLKLYQQLQKGFSVVIALNQSQKWLRDITKRELEQMIREKQLPLDPTLRMNLLRRFHSFPDDVQPFREPFYWAAFCVIGA